MAKKIICGRPVHKDVEFAVDLPGRSGGGWDQKMFSTFEAAAAAAVQHAVSRGETTNLDVVVYSAAGARAWGGDDAVEQYEEDPEVSVFERFEISVNAVGRVP